jgi:riboflavin synthase
MFTGIIEGVGAIASIEPRGGDVRLRIATGTLPFDEVRLGESIAVNGVCLTVVAFDATSFEADASTETLALTTLGRLPCGAAVNLERAMRPSDRLGGHLVSGHVDGVSLTVNEVDGEGFDVALVPHTVAHTAFATTRIGDAVNLEIDLFARYVERLLTGDRA